MGHSVSVKGTIFILAAALCYAFLPIFTRWIYQYEQLQPMDVATWRFLVATITVWGLALVRQEVQPIGRQQLGTLLGLGALFSIAALLAAFSLERVPASTYTLLIYTYPAMVALIGFAIGEKLGLHHWGSIGLALLGCILTVSGRLEISSFVSVLLPLLNAFSYAIYMVLAGRYNRTTGLFAGTLTITGTTLVYLMMLPFLGLDFPTTWQGTWAIIGLGTISTVIPIVLMLLGITLVGATNSAILSTLEPVLTILLAAGLLHERIVALQLLGGALIIASVILLHLPRRNGAEASANPELNSVSPLTPQ